MGKRVGHALIHAILIYKCYLKPLLKNGITRFCAAIVGKKDQDKFFDEGKTKVKWPDGKHNKTPSEAVDSVPYPIDWNDRERFIGYGCYVLGGVADALYSAGKMKHKVRWGGDWNHTDREFTPQNFNDYPHFELVGVE